jgi:hypothetical protein
MYVAAPEPYTEAPQSDKTKQAIIGLADRLPSSGRGTGKSTQKSREAAVEMYCRVKAGDTLEHIGADFGCSKQNVRQQTKRVARHLDGTLPLAEKP